MLDALESRALLSANLAVAFPFGVPATFAPDGSNRVVISISNVGDTSAKSLLTLTLYASADDQLDAADELLDSGSKATTLRAGKTVTVKFAVDTPQGLPDGDYRLLAQIDGGSGVPGDDQAHNIAVSSTTVAIRSPFVDFSGAIPPFSDKPIVIGPKLKPVKGSMTLQNNGNVAARADVRFALFVSADDVLDASDGQIQPLRHQVVNVPAGKSKVIKTRITPPAELPSGAYRLIVVIDPSELIVESNESNNLVVSPNAVAVVNTRVT